MLNTRIKKASEFFLLTNLFSETFFYNFELHNFIFLNTVIDELEIAIRTTAELTSILIFVKKILDWHIGYKMD